MATITADIRLNINSFSGAVYRLMKNLSLTGLSYNLDDVLKEVLDETPAGQRMWLHPECLTPTRNDVAYALGYLVQLQLVTRVGDYGNSVYRLVAQPKAKIELYDGKPFSKRRGPQKGAPAAAPESQATIGPHAGTPVVCRAVPKEASEPQSLEARLERIADAILFAATELESVQNEVVALESVRDLVSKIDSVRRPDERQ